MSRPATLPLRALAAVVFLAAACVPAPQATITGGGSTSVAPLTEAIARGYEREATGVGVELVAEGTGTGLRRLCAGELDLAGASRPIKREELSACAESGVDFLELMVAFDAVAVVVHPANDFVASVAVDELRRMWEPAAEGRVSRWRDVRSAWPDRPLRLAAPGADSGTYDYFTRAVVGEEGTSRSDYVRGSHEEVARLVAGDPDALGFVSLGTWSRHAGRLRLVAVDDGVDGNGRGPRLPDARTLRSGAYQPLGRPLLVYVTRAALSRPEVVGLLRRYVAEAGPTAERLGLVALPDDVYEAGRRRIERRLAGSVFEGGSAVGLSRTSLLGLELEQLMDLEVE